MSERDERRDEAGIHGEREDPAGAREPAPPTERAGAGAEDGVEAGEDARPRGAGAPGDPTVVDLESTAELSAREREAMIAGMSPQDAARVPEMHEVDPIPQGLREEIEAACERYPEKRSAVIPALWSVQRHYGWCSPAGMRIAAAILGETPGYVESVASFYDLFHLEPAGSHQVLVCTNISCWLNGADDLLGAFCEAAGCDVDEASHGGSVSADGRLRVSGFECLGACDIAPMASIDERYFGPLELGDAPRALAQLAAGEAVLPEKRIADRPAAGGPEPEPDERIAAVEHGGAG